MFYGSITPRARAVKSVKTYLFAQKWCKKIGHLVAKIKKTYPFLPNQTQFVCILFHFASSY